MERLTERKRNFDGTGVAIKEITDGLLTPFAGEILTKLADYEDLEEQELLLKLPRKEVYSKSGDEVYLIFEDEIMKCIHCGLDICGTNREGYIIISTYEDVFPYRDPYPEYDLDPTDWCRNTEQVSLSEIGKTLFFTREEAEKKLKEMESSRYETR